MEINSALVGAKLSEIQKRPDEVKLVFENTRDHKTYVLAFKGMLFETATSSLNKRVKYVNVGESLGFRAIAQLRSMNRNLDNYRQLFIQMEGSTDDQKIELLGALKEYKISPRRRKVTAVKQARA